jgi:hypothetical protein
MKTKLTAHSLEKISTPLFFFLLLLYQFFFTLQGIDFLDEGFSATFYQQFYHDPQSVQYNFLYWLSGLVGGTWYYLFPGSGLLGLRFLAIICTMSTIIMVYNLLKPYCNRTHIKIGLALVTLAVCWNPKIFHYNFLSIVLYTGAVSLLFNVLKRNKWILFFPAGALVALDFFARIPSILNLGLVVVIAFYGYLNKKSIWTIIKQSLIFGAGFLFMVAAVLLFMKMIGQLEVYQGALQIAFSMGKSDAADSEYGFVKLLTQFFGSYNAALYFSFYILLLLLLAAIGPRFAKNTFRIPDWIITIGKIACLVLAALIILKGLEILIRLYVGITLITAILILTTHNSKDVKTLMLAGTYVSLTYALGSSAGIFTAGVHIFWIAMPISIDFILNLTNFNNNLRIGYKNETEFKTDVFVSKPQMRNLKFYIIGLCVLGAVYHQWKYPLHDEASRLNMRYPINNKYVRGIFTIKEKADATNELLEKTGAFIKPGDYVISFHSFPMYHFMTNTRPFSGNPMPWYYQPAAFRDQLWKAVDRTHTLPFVVIQKIKTTPNDHGDWPDPWPSDPIFYKPETDAKTLKHEAVMQEFLNKFGYTVAWENNLFKLMIPGKSGGWTMYPPLSGLHPSPEEAKP